ncbi:MAG: thiamine pyrophosphate-dependent dehydrogenase E1 component subunit alpha [Woeseiaceae bacterium]|nr:thiamine pyrophosphate-dependent dehydrogenase E1 component subunit alpha [Woeseiaceae bacterium]
MATRGARLGKEQLLEAFRRMRTIREFEDRIHVKNQAGEVPGFIHLSAGQEASAVGICMHLDGDEHITSTHRGHGHSIAKGCDVVAMMDEIYAKRSGLCGGKGGSMHMADLSKGMIGANGIVGGGVPLAAGAALKSHVLGLDKVAVAFFGDGAYNEGATLETMNLAKVLNLPLVFALENNGYGEATPSSYAIGGDVEERAKGFGLQTYAVDGHDFFAVHEIAGKAIREARDGKGPVLLHISIYRYYGHFEGDAASYRPDGEADDVREKKDCLMLFRQKAVAGGQVTDQELDEVEKEVVALLDHAIEHAVAAASPGADDLLTDVYVSY